MTDFLHAAEHDEAIDALIQTYMRDPSKVCARLAERVEEYRLSSDANCALGAFETLVRKRMNGIDACIVSFEAALPVRHSMFRGGEDAKQMYVALCPFLRQLAEQRCALRAPVGDLSTWRDRLLVSLVELSKAERDCTVLLHYDAERKELDPLMSEIKCETNAQTDLFKRMEHRLAALARLEREVIGRFLKMAEAQSDAEHDGANCDCTGIMTLVATFKKQITSDQFFEDF